MFYLVGQVDLRRNIEWSFGGKVWTPDDYYSQGVLNVTIKWPMFSMSSIDSDYSALRTVASLLLRDKLDWVSFSDETWVVDLEKLRSFCLAHHSGPDTKPYAALDTLKGKRILKTEVKWKRSESPEFQDMYDLLIYLHVFKDWKGLTPPPQFDLHEIRKALWILECEKSMKQGTAFSLANVGVVTCQHVLGPSTYAFRAYDISRKYPVKLIASNAAIDLAILHIESEDKHELVMGTADELEELDQIAIIGFPNYRKGEMGTVHTGFVSGFRTVSSIRRILVNAPIVAGCSGGPAVNGENQVIGVAVTGTDRMEEANSTENHALIPIDSIKFLGG